MVDYFVQHLWQAWAIAALVCLILELTSGDLYVICFAFGCMMAALAAACGLHGWLQIITFSVFTLVALAYLRPVAKNFLHKGGDYRLSNAEALIGRIGIVSETIAAGGYGRVAIDGDDWKAVAPGAGTIIPGTRVRVTAVDSVILSVVPQ